MPKVSYPYEVNGKFVTGNGSLIPICSLSNCSLLPSLTVLKKMKKKSVGNDFTPFFLKATCIKLFSIHLKNDVGFCWISRFSDVQILDLQIPRVPDSQIFRFPDAATQTSNPNLTTFLTRPGITNVARSQEPLLR